MLQPASEAVTFDQLINITIDEFNALLQQAVDVYALVAESAVGNLYQKDDGEFLSTEECLAKLNNVQDQAVVIHNGLLMVNYAEGDIYSVLSHVAAIVTMRTMLMGLDECIRDIKKEELSSPTTTEVMQTRLAEIKEKDDCPCSACDERRALYGKHGVPPDYSSKGEVTH